ncbi:MAG: hypothetical protein HY791_12585 [Deltaproteobacteria bacterium]|nr:hypothetical protein [Deltaproteobacteria bacterium]
MSTPIRVSRHGLTVCPACAQHIRVAPELRATNCPFCAFSFELAHIPADLASSALATRSGRVLAALQALSTRPARALAASVMSLSVVATGCNEAPAVPLYGIAPPDATAEDARVDAGRADLGVADAGATDAEPDAAIVPLYGSPPDAGSADAGQVIADASPSDSGADPDAAIVPLYGAPPTDASAPADSGNSDSAEAVDTGEPVIVPLYGISPVDAG